MTPTKDTPQSRYDYTYADAWMPDEGDIIEGTVASIDTGASGYGPYPIVTVEREDGSKAAVHCFHQAIRGQLARIKPEVGDPIGIKYLGRKKSTTNPKQSYAVYRVVTEGAGGYDWSRETDGLEVSEEDDPLNAA